LTGRESTDETHNSLSHVTVGAVALDLAGNLAAATSTGGTLNKPPGRVGDTTVIGAETWADNQVAISCTGQGEYFLCLATTRDVVARMAYQGVDVDTATEAVIAAIGSLGGDGGSITVVEVY
jgi:beta-aspartyl-peptidase (threonine type)